MNQRDFIYWLRGYFELVKNNQLNEEQVKIIREHLDKVFSQEETPMLLKYMEHIGSC